MSVKRSYLAAAAIAVIIIILGVYLLSGQERDTEKSRSSKTAGKDQGNLIANSDPATDNNSKKRDVAQKKAKNKSAVNNKNYNNTVNSQNRTLKYVNGSTLDMFQALEVKFKDNKEKTIYDHFENVRNFLLEQYPREKALSLFNIYKDYLKCKMEVHKKQQRWGYPSNPEEALQRLEWIQDYRNERLGEELTKRLYGDEMQKKKYNFKKSAILKSDELAQEKERQLRDLRREMQEQGIKREVQQDNYREYQQKLMLYDKDLAQMSKEERKQKIREIRKETFSQEVVEKMQKVDQQQQRYEKNVQKYRNKKEKIKNNQDLTKQEKKHKLEELRKNLFGDRAEAVKRRENKREALQELREKHSE